MQDKRDKPKVQPSLSPISESRRNFEKRQNTCSIKSKETFFD